MGSGWSEHVSVRVGGEEGESQEWVEGMISVRVGGEW